MKFNYFLLFPTKAKPNLAELDLANPFLSPHSFVPYLMKVFSQNKFLKVSGGGRRGPDGLPHLLCAVSQVVRPHSGHESVVPEHVGLQRQTSVDDGAHCCHLEDKNDT